MRPPLSFLAPAFVLAFAVSVQAQPKINGPMPGYSELLESIIWLQCDGPCTVQLEYWKEGKPDSLMRTTTQTGDPAKAYAMDFMMDHVVPGTTYNYRVLADGKEVKFPEVLRFHTQPLWRWRTDPPAFTVAMGSCA
jgi:alkaline phosphatase D